ncbi:MAG: transporter substrate-binding domain-containing protein [Bacteroidota bacterium]
MRSLILLFLFLFTHQPLGAQLTTDTLKVGYTSAPPFIIEAESGLEGINVWLWQQMANDLDLAYELIPMEFSEMLEAVEKGTIDVSINPLTITSERTKKMSFTHSFFASNSTIAVHEIPGLLRAYQFLQSIFNINFLSGFLALFIIIAMFGWTAWIFEHKVNPEEFRPGWKGLWDGLWWSVVTMTTVGYGDKSPKSRGGKLIALIWMFSGLLFISGLTASVASSLTVNQLKSNPESFNEFKDRPVGCIKNSSAEEFLRMHFFRNIQLYPDLRSGLVDLNTDKIDALLYDEPILKYRIKENDEFSGIQLLPAKFDVQFYAFGLPKEREALKEALSTKMLEIIEGLEWRMILNEYDLSEI